RAVDDRFVPLEPFKDGWRIPIVRALIPERQPGWIVGMAGHLHVVLFADRYHLLKKVRDALPVIVGRNPACLAHGQIFPIVVELESRVRDSASTSHSRVSAYRDHRPMMRDHLYTDFGSVFDISHDGVKSSIAFGALPQHDVIGVHSDSFEDEVG